MGSSGVKLKDGNFYKEGRKKRLTAREVLFEIEGLELMLEVSQAAVRQANERSWWDKLWRKK